MATTITVLDSTGVAAQVSTIETARDDAETARDAALAAAARAELASDASAVREIFGVEGTIVDISGMGNYVILSSDPEWVTDTCTLDASNITSTIKFDIEDGANNPLDDVFDFGVRCVATSTTSINHDISMSVKFLDSAAAAIKTLVASPLKGKDESQTSDGRYHEFDTGSGTIKRYSAIALESIQVPTGAEDMEITLSNAFTLTGDVTIQVWIAPGPYFGSADFSYAFYECDAVSTLGSSGTFATISIALDEAFGANVADDFTLAADIVTITRTGLYEIGYSSNVQITAGAADNDIALRIGLNGSTLLDNTLRTVVLNSGTFDQAQLHALVLKRITQGDTIRFEGTNQTAANASRTFDGSGGFWIKRIA